MQGEEENTEIPAARVGRENQRYDEDGLRLNDKGEREFLVISSSKDPSKYIFPKGGWESDETVEDAAQRETLEEAGVVVRLEGALGWFDVCSAKSHTRCCLFKASCVEERQDWPEKGRARHWRTAEEIKLQCKHPYMLEALARIQVVE